MQRDATASDRLDQRPSVGIAWSQPAIRDESVVVAQIRGDPRPDLLGVRSSCSISMG